MAAVRQVSVVSAKVRVEPVAPEVSAVPEAWADAAARVPQADRVVVEDPSEQADSEDRPVLADRKRRADVRVPLRRFFPAVRSRLKRRRLVLGADGGVYLTKSATPVRLQGTHGLLD